MLLRMCPLTQIAYDDMHRVPAQCLAYMEDHVQMLSEIPQQCVNNVYVCHSVFCQDVFACYAVGEHIVHDQRMVEAKALLTQVFGSICAFHINTSFRKEPPRNAE